MSDMRAAVSLSAGYRAVSICAAIVSVVLGLVVFYVDTFMNAESAISVLYGLAILLAAEVLSRRGLFTAALVCSLATVLSLLVSHPGVGNMAAELRAAVSLAAIVMTTAVLTMRGIAEERLMETNVALERSEARFRAIFEDSRVALWEQDFTKLRRMLGNLRAVGVDDVRHYAVQNPEFRRECASLVSTTAVNNATHELLGTRSAQDVSGSIERFLPWEDACFIDLVDCLFTGGRRFEGKCRLLRSDGTALSVLVGLSFPQDDRDYGRIVVGMFDVTQRELTQQALLVAQAEMARASRIATVGALSASIAHEINQPIGAMVLNAKSCLRWLRRDPPDILSASDAAERIARDGHRAAQILKSTRQMVVSNPVQSEILDLGDLIGESCLLLEQELRNAAVALHTRMPSNLPRIRIARAEFQQVLVNLLSNGIHAVSEAGRDDRRLAIECAMDGDSTVRVSVRDHGPGIAEENLAKLFNPFFTTKPSGMGIGLSICRSIVEGQGGQLTARNHSAGGAIFEMSLPVEVQHG